MNTRINYLVCVNSCNVRLIRTSMMLNCVGPGSPIFLIIIDKLYKPAPPILRNRVFYLGCGLQRVFLSKNPVSGFPCVELKTKLRPQIAHKNCRVVIEIIGIADRIKCWHD